MALEKKENAIELQGITKTFGSVVANDHINLEVRRGEILALLGENGSGKTTLMNMISGIYHPDEGVIKVNGKEVTINSPMDAGKLGIGMIHQHFKLVDVFSAMDNVAMGMEGKRVKPKELKERLLKLTEKYGLEVEPEKKIYNMSVSEKQTVEILKVRRRLAICSCTCRKTCSLIIGSCVFSTRTHSLWGLRTLRLFLKEMFVSR